MGIFRHGASVAGGIIGGVLALALGAYAILGPQLDTKFESPMVNSSIQISDFCSGTFIQDPIPYDGLQPTIITAKHCIPTMSPVGEGKIIPIPFPVYVADRTARVDEVDFVVTDVSDDSDLAILQYYGEDGPEILKKHGVMTATVYPGNVTFGDRVFALAFPYGWSKTVTEGVLGFIEIVEPFKTLSKSGEFRRSTTQTARGSSGGGLFYRTDEGVDYLVGVLTGGAGEFVTYWTPLEELRRYVKTVGAKVEKEFMEEFVKELNDYIANNG